MATPPRAVGLAAMILAILLAACGETGRHVSGPEPGPYRIHGVLVDSTSGAPVSRTTFYVHLFCDEVDFQWTFDPADDTGYSVRVPRRSVRVRAYDRSDTYRLFEKTVEIVGAEMRYDIALEPTGYAVLRGRVTHRASGRPIVTGADGGHGPIFGLSEAGGRWRGGFEILDDDGTYSVRVPRTKLHIDTIDTALGPVVREIDLTGFEGETFEHDIEME